MQPYRLLVCQCCMNEKHVQQLQPPPRVLMVYPRIPETFWSYTYSLPFVGKRATMPPLGLLTVAAIAGDQLECRLVDMNIEKLTDRDLQWADLVMVSAMIVQADSFADVVARCNDQGIPVAAGGPYPTSCHEEISGVDYFVLGEAEVTLLPFLKDLREGRPQPLYTSESWADMTTTPVPRFDLCNLDAYNSLPVQFSRGCPFNCEFCDIVHLFGHRCRTKTPENFIGELQTAYDLGFKGDLFIVDDNFIGNRRRVEDLLHAVYRWQIEHDYPFKPSTEASIDLAYDDALMDLLVRCGFHMVFVGLETPMEESLLETGKLQNVKRSMQESVKALQRRGIEVTAGFIVGFDADPPDIFRRQREFIRELAIPTAMVGLLTALPNTRLYDRLQLEGRILNRASGNNTHQNGLNFIPHLPTEIVRSGYQRLLRQIYNPRQYFSRCLRFVSRLPYVSFTQRVRHKQEMGLREFRALLACIRNQVFSRYSWWYLLYIVRAIAIRPRQFVRIMTLAVQGHHYFAVAKT